MKNLLLILISLSVFFSCNTQKNRKGNEKKLKTKIEELTTENNMLRRLIPDDTLGTVKGKYLLELEEDLEKLNEQLKLNFANPQSRRIKKSDEKSIMIGKYDLEAYLAKLQQDNPYLDMSLSKSFYMSLDKMEALVELYNNHNNEATCEKRIESVVMFLYKKKSKTMGKAHYMDLALFPADDDGNILSGDCYLTRETNSTTTVASGMGYNYNGVCPDDCP